MHQAITPRLRVGKKLLNLLLVNQLTKRGRRRRKKGGKRYIPGLYYAR